MTNNEKVPGRRSLNLQYFSGVTLLLPLAVVAMWSVTCWIGLIQQPHRDVLMMGLWTLPGLILFVVLLYLAFRASRLILYYYHTAVEGTGTVSELIAGQDREFALVTSCNRAGQPLSTCVPVPVEKVGTVHEGDSYPW